VVKNEQVFTLKVTFLEKMLIELSREMENRRFGRLSVHYEHGKINLFRPEYTVKPE
jgi:hypothetical protein